ncbi:MAG TPA: family 43 glycosylhydrolase [Actinotalea sp.]|nr:family 43 glycosylhydrolase [Actinotalea sp.]
MSDAPDQRPVLPGFHPDPTVCRVGDTYYLATSSFEYGPAVPVFRSTDLRDWQPIGHALATAAHVDLTAALPSSGVLAPTLRHHDGRFWLITTNLADGGGQLVVSATDPSGPWSAPTRFPTLSGIDPDLAWDEDGRCHVSFAGFGPHGPEGIQQVEVDLERGDVLTARRHLWSGTGAKFPEAPHLYHVGDWWYLVIAEGGTERGHAVSVARSRSVSGPFEGCPANPVLTRRGTDRPVQSTGHADLVERPDGRWAAVYHGVRPRGGSPQWHVLGRETFVDEIEWSDGWPVFGRHVAPTTAPGAVVTRALDDDDLARSWVSPGGFASDVLTPAPGGWRLVDGGEGRTFVGRRQQWLYVDVRARVRVDGPSVGGLALRIDPSHEIAVELDAGSVRAVLTVGAVRTVLGQRAAGADAELELRVLPADGLWWSTALGPDRVEVGLREAGAFVPLGSVDGRYLSTEVAGGMTGRMVGLHCSAGSVLVRGVVCTGTDDADAISAALGA